tara:strand:- start:330 stop:488 length:159 start_codon:yes stop_codon:yes gene_type:complete
MIKSLLDTHPPTATIEFNKVDPENFPVCSGHGFAPITRCDFATYRIEKNDLC